MVPPTIRRFLEWALPQFSFINSVMFMLAKALLVPEGFASMFCDGPWTSEFVGESGFGFVVWLQLGLSWEGLSDTSSTLFSVPSLSPPLTITGTAMLFSALLVDSASGSSVAGLFAGVSCSAPFGGVSKKLTPGAGKAMWLPSRFEVGETF
uniref:Putative secreted protein n=1 Tax=Ixodes ricinus TaxID=34613 RepID=A0A6B0UV42_IXORI